MEFDTNVAHPARVYDYWLGGKDHFEADRAAGVGRGGGQPGDPARRAGQPAFLARAVQYLADAGIRQFLDIGTGLPSANNTHEVAQAAAPESRVVYVDNDPIVLAHARALLPARRKAPPPTSTRTPATWTRCCARRRRRWTSASRWRSWR